MMHPPNFVPGAPSSAAWSAAGETRWLRDSATIQRRADGTAARVVGADSDITEQQVAAERLSNLSNRPLLAQRARGLGVLDWDITADCMLWNDRMFELFDVPHPSSADVINARNLRRSRLHPEDAEAAERDLQNAAKGRRHYEAEFRLLTRAGETRHIEGDALVETDGDGKPRRLVGVYQDITGAVEARNRLRQDAEILGQVGERRLGVPAPIRPPVVERGKLSAPRTSARPTAGRRANSSPR